MPDDQEPPIREFADRGILWLLESSENLRELVRIAAADIAERLDFARSERVNRSFIPDDLHKQEADLLYRVPFRRGTGEVWVYLLLEHQSRPDRTMGLRLLSYMVQLWEMQRRAWQDAGLPVSKWRLHPIIPVVFYTGKRRWTAPISLTALMDAPALLTRFVPTHDTLFLKLQELAREQLTGSAMAAALRVLQAAEEPQEVLSAVLIEAVEALRKLPPEAQAEWQRALRYLLLLIRHKREPEERDSLYDIVTDTIDSRSLQEVTNMARTDAQVLMAEGRKEGRLEGRQEMLLEQLEYKFGTLPENVVEAVKRLSVRRIRTLSQRVFTAQTLADLGL